MIESLNKEMKLKFYHQNLRDINEWIKVADNKANFLVAFYTLVVGSLLVQLNEYIKIVENYKNIIIFIFINLFLLLTIIFIGKSFWLFYSAVHPRISSQRYIKNKQKSYVFWKDIASFEYNEFKLIIQDLEIDNLFNDILRQVFINSKICEEKFKNVENAYKLILPTLISLVIYTVILKIGS